MLLVLLLLLLQPTQLITRKMITDDDVDNDGKGGGHGDIFGCSDSSVTPQLSSTNTLQSFRHRFLFSVRRPCRRNRRQQWLDRRLHRRDDLTANTTLCEQYV